MPAELGMCHQPHNAAMQSNTLDIAQAAARLVVEEGLEFRAAKYQALQSLGLPSRTPMPNNEEVEAQVREHISIFCAEEQAQELAALRRMAVVWMQRMADFRPYLTGSVWRGTATKHSDVYIQLFCDDSKSAEIALIDHQVRYEPTAVVGMRGKTVDALSIVVPCTELNAEVLVHLMVYDHDDLRGALKPDRDGRAPRGNIRAVQALLAADSSRQEEA